jgi:hypothetical protein
VTADEAACSTNQCSIQTLFPGQENFRGPSLAKKFFEKNTISGMFYCHTSERRLFWPVIPSMIAFL